MKKFITIFLISFCFGVSPQQWLVDRLELDGMSVLHYIGGNFYARGMTSVALWEKIDQKPMTNKFTVISGVTLILGWEVGQYYYYGGFKGWSAKYGSADRARKNALVDIGLGCIGLWTGLRWKALRKPKKTPEINYNFLNQQIQIEWRF